MTEELHRYTRKRLAAMARHQHVSGWHEMRKAELIEALEAQPSEDDAQAFPATFPVRDGAVSRSDRVSPREDRSNGHASRRLKTPVRRLLHSVERSTDHFVGAAVSSHWLRAEWALSHDTLLRVETALGVARHTARPVLRLYDVSSDDRMTHAVTFVSDTEIPADVHEWFVEVDQPGGVYQLQLGIRAQDGEFHRLCSSDRIDTGEPLSSPVSPVAVQPTPEVICRRGNGRAARTTTIPLTVEAELLLRGDTHPQALLAIANESIPLETDGGFQYRRQLTDGRHVIPTTVLSPDGRRQHTIVLAIECNTKHLAPRGPDDL